MNHNSSHCQLDVINVSHFYEELCVVKSLDFKVEKGEFLVVVGPSGCGKTTLLNLLAGHLEPAVGSIKQKGLIRTVYQGESLFPWLTVSENIKMGFSLRGDEPQQQSLDELIEMVHLQGFGDHYPHQLSGGMKQRVEIARVLAGDSDVLLMDEPFSALDYQTRLRMRSELVRLLLKRPRTVVFVTHDIEEAVLLGDRVLVLSNRPASISCELRIKSPKPRDPTSPEVLEALKTILRELGLQDFNRTIDFGAKPNC